MIKSHVLFLSTLQWLKAQQVYYEILYVCVTVLLLRNSVEVHWNKQCREQVAERPEMSLPCLHCCVGTKK